MAENIEITDIIIEGTDGVGKTETIERLKKELPYYTFHDRNKEVISAKMTKDTPLKDRAEMYEIFLNAKKNFLTIVLINNDGEELLRRVKTRNKPISDFDLEAPFYNKLYRETYEYMRDNGMLCGRLKMVDVTGMSMDTQVQEVINAVHLYERGGWV